MISTTGISSATATGRDLSATRRSAATEASSSQFAAALASCAQGTVASPGPPTGGGEHAWMTRNLSAQDRSVLAQTFGVKFPPSGGILWPVSGTTPNDSYAVEKTVLSINANRGDFPRDLTAQDLLHLAQQNLPGSDPEPIWEMYTRLRTQVLQSSRNS